MYLYVSHCRVWLFVTSWTVAVQASLSMKFSRPGYWSGLPFPSPCDFPDPGIEPGSPALQANFLLSEPLGKPLLRANVPPNYILRKAGQIIGYLAGIQFRSNLSQSWDFKLSKATQILNGRLKAQVSWSSILSLSTISYNQHLKIELLKLNLLWQSKRIKPVIFKFK